jgi:hypothetical protein
MSLKVANSDCFVEMNQYFNWSKLNEEVQNFVNVDFSFTSHLSLHLLRVLILK